MTTRDLLQYPKHIATGTGTALLSNRVSYCFNLHGPSITLDTGCSSSLVCFHLGNQSLQSGETDYAIVAGSALHFDPGLFVTMTDFGLLSSDGRCRTFDANGSGYVRGEGICAIILKRQSAAKAAGDPIRAIVRGSASNHDGLTNCITLPNEKAQIQLLRDVYKQAGLNPSDTYYFESHGTGTQAGDPREAKAIGTVFGPHRTEPLLVGSIKSNLGHLEGASGLAGIIKATMSIETGTIMPNMHFNTPNLQIDFDACNIQVPTEMQEWKPNSEMRRASVNSFGYGGTNAHVILENYPEPPVSKPIREGSAAIRPFLLPLTSHTEKGGHALLSTVRNYLLEHPETTGSDLAYSYSVRRTMHDFRSFAVGYHQQSFLKVLSHPDSLPAWKKRLNGKPRLGFVFTGQGVQWHAMGRQLIVLCPLFRQSLERCDKILQQLPDPPG